MLSRVGSAARVRTTVALKLVEALDPQLLIVDLAMPGMNGVETTRQAFHLNRELKVILITLHNDRRLWTMRCLPARVGV